MTTSKKIKAITTAAACVALLDLFLILFIIGRYTYRHIHLEQHLKDKAASVCSLLCETEPPQAGMCGPANLSSGPLYTTGTSYVPLVGVESGQMKASTSGLTITGTTYRDSSTPLVTTSRLGSSTITGFTVTVIGTSF